MPPLSSLRDLPALPPVAAQAAAAAQDPSSTPQDLLRIILGDPPLASKVLKAVQSVQPPGARGVSDLQTAIVRLGFSNIRNLMMGMAAMRAFHGYFVGSPFSREDFWIHSISVGVLAARLGSRDDRCDAATAFVGGLLHDVGKLLLDRHAREDFRHTLRLAEAEGIPLFEAERRRFGRDHAALSGELLELWRFPRELIEPVRWHHEPAGCEAAHRPHAVLLQTADWICSAHAIGYSGNPNPEAPSVGDLAGLGLDEGDVDAWVRELRKDPLPEALIPV
jgi:putative nucleotidyltransferase with HDIG domain